RIKAETASARQQLNTTASKGQLRIRRELGSMQQTLKNELFKAVMQTIEDYKKTEDYLKLLVTYISDTAMFADGQPLMIYISASDEEKKDYLEQYTGMTVTISEEDFIGGVRSVIPGRNILIDHSFRGALEKEYQEYTFKGGGAR